MKTKSELRNLMNKVSMSQIPESALDKEVLKQLEGRESFKDADADLDEKIYTGDVFEAILGEADQLPEGHIMRPSKEAMEQLEALAQLCIHEYIQITKH